MSSNAAPEHFRPFDIELAKQGAPYALVCGFDVTIYKFDGRGLGGPIIGIFGGDDRPSTWRADGTFSIEDCPRMNLVLPPIGYVDEKPVFVGDILIDQTGAEHPARVTMRFATEGAWRWPKPADPERVYPVTRMSRDALFSAFYDKSDQLVWQMLEDVANAALRHAIDAGQVVASEDRDARDMAIAQAVMQACHDRVDGSPRHAYRVSSVDLPTIIAGIKV